MKNFSSKTRVSSRRKTKILPAFWVSAVILGAIFLVYIAGGFLGQITAFVTEPIFRVQHWVANSSATIPSYLRGRNELIAEIERLKTELAASSGKSATLSRVTNENEELRSLLAANDTKRIAAGIIARPPHLPYDAFMIDRGRDDGVEEGAIVYHGDDHAIGYISRAFGTSALVTLFSTPGVTATAFIFGPDIYATAYGLGGGVIRISIPQGIMVAKGDVVVLPSIEAGVIGTVGEIESVATQPEQHAYIISEVPIQSMRLVSVSPRVLREITFEEAKDIIEGFTDDALRIEVPESALFGTTGTSTATTTATSTIEEAAP